MVYSQPSAVFSFHKQTIPTETRTRSMVYRRLRVRGKSVSYMREYPGPLVEVNRELVGVGRVCVEMRRPRWAYVLLILSSNCGNKPAPLAVQRRQLQICLSAGGHARKRK